MKKIFQKHSFAQAPGGDRYDWKEAETQFDISEKGIYIIEVTASTQNGKQNKTGDDDDLRLTLDGYKFGKDEVHENKTSWHGFGVAASWDGASLKGGEKTVYFFVELDKGQHIIKFFADNKPKLNSLAVHQLEQDGGVIEDAIFEFSETATGVKSDRGGIPWKAFVFQSQFNTDPFRVYLAEISATCLSGKQKKSTDGDNIKVYTNGHTVANPKSPTSNKYKNFFFSGDQMQGETRSLMVSGDQFLYSQSGDFSIEIWYDETPTLERVRFEIPGGTKYDKGLLKKWRSHIAELLELPSDTTKNIILINSIVNESVKLAEAYADQKEFYTYDSNGNKVYLTLNNEVDAFRHFVWTSLLFKVFGKKDAELITTNHEIFWRNASNKKDFSTDGIMDLWNNMMGLKYVQNYPNKSMEELFEQALLDGVIVTELNEVTQEIRYMVLKQIK